MWAGTTALQAWTPDQTKQARVISAPTLPSSSSIYIIPRKNQKQTNKTKNYTTVWKLKKSQMNITFLGFLSSVFGGFLNKKPGKKEKNYTEQLLTFLWAYMYTIKTTHQEKTKQTNKLHI